MDTLAESVMKTHSNLSFAQFLVLLCSYVNPGRTQKFTSSWLQITEATVSYMVKRLTKLGYLEVRLDKLNARSRQLFLTDEGAELVRHIYPLLEDALRPHLSQIPASEVTKMISQFDVIHQSIENQLKGECHE
jgi:DNA-binding MarR family transcriptional regulator